MKEIGILNKRKIIYQEYALNINWTKVIPDKNWLLFVIIDGQDQKSLNEISNKALDGDVCIACCVGKQGELLHDIIDNDIVFREVDIDNHHIPPFDVLITTWHNDLDEAFWFAIFVANNEPHIIDTILCLDASESPVKIELEGLVKKYIAEKD